MRVLVVVLCSFGVPASASNVEHWEEVGAWEILVDASVGNGCLAQRVFEDGTLVQIGAEPVRNGGFFAAYNAEWSDIEIGATGIVNMDFGDARFAGEVVGKVNQDLPGGYAFFDNPNFVTEFGQRQSVKISGESGRLIEIDLTGSKRAIEAVLDCQKEQPEPVSD
ncbi:hypothetical protein FEE96_20820 [Parasedimentitalea maritima]|uniref:Uncharacterized protein n=1 Tax=Parasedimentitalea maritima TaxID=2578117 RepID=A0ABY2UPY7_9RHOB|nr:hypothetical protein [Zongyanglinia marina]TLP56903.1 hypothetical protein FEE96_20820 [Zongyanglinia marina]